MQRRGIVIAAIIGLVFAIVETVLFPLTLSRVVNTTGVSLVAAILGLLAAGIAGRIILGTRSVHRYYRAGVPVLAAIAGFAFESAFSNWLISQDVIFGHPPTTLRPAVIVAIVIGAVAYLIGATLYGFAGTSQGVKVESRVRLLLLLLLAVVPVANILGLAGFVIVGFLRKPVDPAPEVTATPGPAAASE